VFRVEVMRSNKALNFSSQIPDSKCFVKKFPPTRYQGSKYKLLPWLENIFKDINFNNCLDVFGGTGAVSYLLKTMGKETTYNDVLKFNSIIGNALIENESQTLNEKDVEFILSTGSLETYKNTIESNFQGIYFLDEENRWLDVVIQNIFSLKNCSKRSMALWALFQACLIKRPYNLFHRKNLEMRTREVTRSFGNKVTWDRSFEEHFLKFVSQINSSVFSNGRKNKSQNFDALDIEQSFDLVYIDPPYIPSNGTVTNYHDFYHFLEGICDYENWESNIDFEKKHRPLKEYKSNWNNKSKILGEFEKVLFHYRNSKIVISYRSDGIPTVDELKSMLQRLGKRVEIHSYNYQYALSKKKLDEVVLVAQ
jgi:adenine-specific DNA methylase